MKGISPLISHALFLAIGIGVLIMILATVNTVKEEITETSVTIQLTAVADSIAEQVLDVYYIYEDSNTATVKIKLDIPDKIGNKPYGIFFNNKIVLEGTADQNKVTIERNLSIPIEFSGRVQAPGYLTLENGIIGLVE